jgi:hypothetical protein
MQGPLAATPVGARVALPPSREPPARDGRRPRGRFSRRVPKRGLGPDPRRTAEGMPSGRLGTPVPHASPVHTGPCRTTDGRTARGWTGEGVCCAGGPASRRCWFGVGPAPRRPCRCPPPCTPRPRTGVRPNSGCGSAALPLSSLRSSGAALPGDIAENNWTGYQHQFGGNATRAERSVDDVNFDTELMRLATGGPSQPAATSEQHRRAATRPAVERRVHHRGRRPQPFRSDALRLGAPPRRIPDASERARAVRHRSFQRSKPIFVSVANRWSAAVREGRSTSSR